MRFFKNLKETDDVFSAFEVENLETTTRTVVEATLWMDWWTCSATSLALRDMSKDTKAQRLLVEGTCQILVAKTASTVWANLSLKCHGSVLGKLRTT